MTELIFMYADTRYCRIYYKNIENESKRGMISITVLVSNNRT